MNVVSRLWVCRVIGFRAVNLAEAVPVKTALSQHPVKLERLNQNGAPRLSKADDFLTCQRTSQAVAQRARRAGDWSFGD